MKYEIINLNLLEDKLIQVPDCDNNKLKEYIETIAIPRCWELVEGDDSFYLEILEKERYLYFYFSRV